MTVFKTYLPSVRKGDGSGFANSDTGWRFGAISWFTGSTVVTDLFSFFMFYRSHRFFTKRVYFVRSHFEYFCRAYLHTLATPITLVCVQSEKPISGSILETIIGNHIFPSP